MLRQKWERKGKGAKENTRQQGGTPHMVQAGLQVKDNRQHGVHSGQNAFGQASYGALYPLVGKGFCLMKENEGVFS